MIDVFDFAIDEDNTEKLWLHGITVEQVLDVLDG